MTLEDTSSTIKRSEPYKKSYVFGHIFFTQIPARLARTPSILYYQSQLDCSAPPNILSCYSQLD